jgi:hypothetical protein
MESTLQNPALVVALLFLGYLVSAPLEPATRADRE